VGVTGRKVRLHFSSHGVVSEFVDGEGDFATAVMLCELACDEAGTSLLKPLRGGLEVEALDMLRTERDELKREVSRLEGALAQQDKELARLQAERDDHLSTALRMTKVFLARAES
jgi:hypothetical protein